MYGSQMPLKTKFYFKGQKRLRGFFRQFFYYNSFNFNPKLMKLLTLTVQVSTIFCYFIIFSPRYGLRGVIKP